jgi:oligopeptide/dipeptide ABC transporter ATP-binding protein
MEALLKIENLHVGAFSSDGSGLPILRGVDLSVSDGERVALVGESGCGKTVTALSVMNLLPNPPLKRTDGKIFFEDRDLEKFTDADWRHLRGGEIGMIFQEPLTSLNPSFRAGDQVVEAVLAHRPMDVRAAREEALRLFQETGLPDPVRVASQFPHQLSGGMCQRVMIAMALAGQPRLLIADEPTTALDVTVQAQILDLLRLESQKRRLAVLFVTHDLSLAAGFSDSLAVFYAGRVVERGPTSLVFREPAHPYTQGLLKCQPSRALAGEPLPTLAGSPPVPGTILEGCSFADRCPRAQPPCRLNDPSETEIKPGHQTRCFYPFKP